MKSTIAIIAAVFCLFLSSCHRPVAYFQRTLHPAAARLSVESTPVSVRESNRQQSPPVAEVPPTAAPVMASRSTRPAEHNRVEQRVHRMQLLLEPSAGKSTQQQPQPKPKKKLKLGNQIRQGLGMRLRPELNWWQRISWKLKASVFVILVAVVFAILHIPMLPIIFGIVGAFLLITGLKKSFKVKRPWF